jgi:Gnt-I system high-affinity gluconate transporter
MPLLILGGGILLLFAFILFKVKPLYALLIVSVAVGVGQGLSWWATLQAIAMGIGSTLQGMAIVLALGAMLGGLIESSGAARQITETLIARFGQKNIQWAVMVTGFMIGIPLFYNAGFVILIPLIFSIAIAARLPILQVGIPMAASLSVTHGFLPPHPGPVAIAALFHADLGRTLLFGLLLAFPIAALAGPFFARALKGLNVSISPDRVKTYQALPEQVLPPRARSFMIALLPVVLMALAAAWNFLFTTDKVVTWLGKPEVALALAVVSAIIFLSYPQQRSLQKVVQRLYLSVKEIFVLILVIAAGGGFKQVLVESGISEFVKVFAEGFQLSPLLFAWTMAALLRVSIGSATVAGNTAAGIVVPLLAVPGISPELMVLAVGAGSLMCSHVNDTGFWMFKEYFNLSLRQTFLSWTLMETIVSVLGLAGVLVLDYFV